MQGSKMLVTRFLLRTRETIGACTTLARFSMKGRNALEGVAAKLGDSPEARCSQKTGPTICGMPSPPLG